MGVMVSKEYNNKKFNSTKGGGTSEEIREVKTTRRLHIFHCDGCGKKLLESQELDDGYFEIPNFIDEKIFVGSERKWYHYRTGYLCDDCIEKENKELLKKLIEIGFKEEK